MISGATGKIAAAAAATTDFASASGTSTNTKASESGGGNRSISSEAGEHDAPPMPDFGAHHVETSSKDHVVFGSGAASTLTLGDSFHFKDLNSGPKASGAIDLAELNHIPAPISHGENAAGTQGPPAISEGAQAIELLPPEQHPEDHFSIVLHNAMSAHVTHVPHDLIV